jgi:hypothetical protein
VLLVSCLTMTAALVTTPTAANAATVTVDDLTPPLAPVSLSQLEVDEVTLTFEVNSGTEQARPPKVVDTTSSVPFADERASLVSGNLTTGTWEATVVLASFMDGSHAPRVRVCVTDTSCDVHSLDTSIVVQGSDQPVLKSVSQNPDRLRAGKVSGAEAVGRVVFADSGEPVRGIAVRLVRHSGDTGRLVDRSSSRGRFTSPWPWTRPGQDPAEITLTAPDVPGVRFDRDVLGNPSTRFRVPKPKARALVGPDEKVVVSGTVTPGYPASKLGPIRLQELTDRGWKTRASTQLRQVRDSSGDPVNRARYRLSIRFSKAGKHVLRLSKPPAMCSGGPCRVARANSERFSVVVGNRAFVVERHLDALGVPVGQVDGVVDARSKQAFCAWRDMVGQKPSRQGLSKRLVASVMHHSKLPRPGRPDGLYVNKTCQVLFQVKNHQFRRVVWVSTGAPGYETPSATGHIFRKIDGWVESTLYPDAYMLNPMFFLPGRPAIALHGSASNDLVHPYPASHGCVRTWRPEILHIFDESPIGTRVKVYGSY